MEFHTLPSALEKEAHNKHLQPGHRHHHQALNHAEVEDTTLGATDGAEIPILASTEILLVSGDGRQLCGQLVD